MFFIFFYISKKNLIYKIFLVEKEVVISNLYFVKRCCRNYNVKVFRYF